nr:hypothetical protein [Tanacetum cinerariifolium]
MPLDTYSVQAPSGGMTYWYQEPRGGSGGGSTVVAAGRVRESGIDERIDRETSNLFGFAGKIPPEKFSGGGRRRRVVADRQEAAAGGGGWGEKRGKWCWEVMVEVVGCRWRGESGGKWREKGLQEWRETLYSVQCFKCR